MGHSMSDPVHGVYRTKEEVEEAKQRDPIRIFIDYLKDNKHITDEQVKAIDQRAHDMVEDAAEFADKSAEPGIEELYTDVYATEDVKGRLFFDQKNRLSGTDKG
jgi:pyruvate dehydrogenase E1 component alpha subunit